MRQFRNDYSEGAAPEILDALVRTNAQQTPGYGEDEFCAAAADLIRAICGQPDAFVKFIPGGTAANILAISALTDEFEGPVLAADAHPTIHETGAIEGTGRRLLATRDPFGILTPQEAERVWRDMTSGGCHTTRPGMIYFSNTTEFGHAYTQAEFDALCDWARSHDLAVYVDGARMASALTSPGCDLTLEHLAARADAFTLGGTKAGMLFGEALVVNPRSDRAKRAIGRIPYLTKRAGLLNAKGRLMGVQYQAAFTIPSAAAPWTPLTGATQPSPTPAPPPSQAACRTLASSSTSTSPATSSSSGPRASRLHVSPRFAAPKPWLPKILPAPIAW